MTDVQDTTGASPVLWDRDGPPRSRLFDDVYYSSTDGLSESRAVFLQGCGLLDAWRGRRHFRVAELGFGTGLNIVALLQLWRATREPGARLHIFSVEAFPMPVEDARRALAVWPEIADLAAALTDRWPRRAKGFHRLSFEDWGVILDLALMDVESALEAWTGAADAWFLDGFSPASNPAMWSDSVMAAVARRSAPGARAATFTVAGQVRRSLEAAGFAIEKRPGFGRKRERLEAWLPGAPAVVRSMPAVAIIGAGIAGAALARAFSAQGVRPLLIEAAHPGAGASGNPAALAAPRLDAGSGAVAQLYAQALARAADLFDACPGRGSLKARSSSKPSPRTLIASTRSPAIPPSRLELCLGCRRIRQAPVWVKPRPWVAWPFATPGWSNRRRSWRPGWPRPSSAVRRWRGSSARRATGA